MSLGQALKAQREAKGFSIEDAAVATRVSRKYIHALEDENFLLIPSQVFAKGFLKAYSEFLGLDPRGMLPELMDFYKGKESRKTEEQAALSRKLKPPKDLKMIIYSVIVALVLLAFIIYEYRAAPVKTEPPAAKPPSEVKTAPLKMANTQVEIKLEVVGKTWVQVMVDGKQVYNETLVPGGVQIFRGKVVTVKADNPAGLKVFRDGYLLGLLGQPDKGIERTYRITP